jgi:hypothetical protein
MRAMRIAMLLAAIALAGCGDNILVGSGPDAARSDGGVDAAPVDAFYCAPFGADQLGGPCSLGDPAACGADGVCLQGAIEVVAWPADGYCIRDDGGTTCATDDDCGAGGACIEVADFGPGYRICMAACCDFDTCPAGQACFDTLSGIALSQSACVPGNATARDGDACAGFFDCNEFSQCKNDFEHPGGACERFACTGDADCHGGVCITDDEEPPFAINICVDGCATDADCRRAEGYRCFDPDPQSTTDARYCRHPHVGDPCAAPADCGTGTWECRGTFPGGYCTQTGCETPGSSAGCTPGSLCHDAGEAQHLCVDRCPEVGQQSTCRAGYSCVDVDPGAEVIGGCLPS